MDQWLFANNMEIKHWEGNVNASSPMLYRHQGCKWNNNASATTIKILVEFSVQLSSVPKSSTVFLFYKKTSCICVAQKYIYLLSYILHNTYTTTQLINTKTKLAWIVSILSIHLFFAFICAKAPQIAVIFCCDIVLMHKRPLRTASNKHYSTFPIEQKEAQFGLGSTREG